MLSFESSHLYRRRYCRKQQLCKHILTGCYPSDTITLEPCVGNSFMPCALNNFTPHLEPLLHISLQELNTLDVLEVLVQSYAKL